ncbi:TonB-linked outer membrane protein, SusC/RagA family [Chitinophaga rupis]|uniref:TonB-linked outer membrane protein, SusC/RagA family n=1 Tax=Chitinophaga rupis TaxID=573321 RepID=A0A1H7QAP6_9BACT|nr:SusC/RagA family TonB-linked outer membrane protein [Chitinophaga rupis]SEL44956.1 TonB-linked outer membrane protein, SusC/RagA family [Chitinophaga rupis]
MRTIYLALLCLIVPLLPVLAQTVKVEGTVTDNAKEPLPGVSVRVKSTNTGVTTDAKGHFSLSATPGATLEITYVGFTKQEVKVTGQQNLRVVMAATASALQETVIIGYQQVTRKKATAAISSLSGREIQNLPAASFDQLMQGRLSGVNVQNFTGEPGARTTVSVRGNSAVSRDYNEFKVVNSPLYVVDGIPQPSEEYVTSDVGTGTNFLAGINPMDIATIDVLKDASAAAIYGSRAANGVILITTKKGKSGTPRVSLSSYFGITERPELRDVVLGTEERRQKMALLQQSLTHAQQQQLPFLMTDSLNPAYNANTDWQDIFYRTGLIKNADLSVSGGSENSYYRFSAGYYDEQGVVIGTDFKRYSTRLNLMTRAMNNKLEINPIISFSRTDRHRGNGRPGNSINITTNGDPRDPVTVGAGQMPSSLFALDPDKKAAMLGTYKDALDKNMENQFTINLNLGLFITPHLKLNSQNSYIYKTSRRDYNKTNALTSNNGSFSFSFADNGANLLSSNYLSYTNSFKDHNLSVILGTDMQYDQYQNTRALGYGGSSDQIQVVQGFRQTNIEASSDYQAYGLLSYYSRIAYDFKEKYLLSVSARTDGSSRFGADSKWGFFPSASAAWIISDEPFLQHSRTFSLVKIRGSVGTSGSLPEQNYLQYNLYKVNNGGFAGNSGATSYNGVTAITPNFTDGAAQKGLSWERSVQWNLGTDLEFADGNFAATVDVYNRQNSLQLFSIILPVTSGYDKALTNALGVRNSGVELTVSGYPFKRRNSAIKWFTRLNISYNKNMITSLPNGGRDIVFQNGDRFDKSHILSVGKPLNAFYLYQNLGVFATDDDVPGNKYTGEKFRNGNGTYRGGDFHLADLDGDNFIDIFNEGINPDKMPIGDPNPKITGGFNNEITWKNFILNIFCTFTFDRDVLNLYRADQFSNSTDGDATNRFIQYATPDFSRLDIWRNPGDKATYAKYDLGTYRYYYTSAQTFFLEKGDYLRIKSISLTYNLNPDLLKRWGMDRFSIFGVLDNVAMFQRSKNLPDAEAVNPYGEYNGNGYPIPKKYTMGLSVNF